MKGSIVSNTVSDSQDLQVPSSGIDKYCEVAVGLKGVIGVNAKGGSCSEKDGMEPLTRNEAQVDRRWAWKSWGIVGELLWLL